MLDPTSFSGLLAEYGRAIGWSVAAAIGFSFGVGLALKVFAKTKVMVLFKEHKIL